MPARFTSLAGLSPPPVWVAYLVGAQLLFGEQACIIEPGQEVLGGASRLGRPVRIGPHMFVYGGTPWPEKSAPSSTVEFPRASSRPLARVACSVSLWAHTKRSPRVSLPRPTTSSTRPIFPRARVSPRTAPPTTR